MNALGQYQEDNKLTTKQLTDLLKEKLGRPISEAGVEMMLNRKEPPLPWLNALGISPKEPQGLSDPEKLKNIQPDVKVAPPHPLPFEPITAKATIELIYTMGGKGAAIASKTPAVADAWQNAGPGLADGWIEWAKENRTVANGIALLTVGGPGGQVILMNASLLITTLMLISQQRNIEIIPREFNIYEGMSEDEIRLRTEQAADERLRGNES